MIKKTNKPIMLVTHSLRDSQTFTGVKERASFLLWCVTLLTSITNGNVRNRYALIVKLNYYLTDSLSLSKKSKYATFI